MRFPSLPRAGAAVLLAVASAPSAHAASYRLVDLGVDKIPIQINKHGDIAGETFGETQVFVYRHDAWKDLDAFNLGAVAAGIDAAGDVVGNDHWLPTVWPRGARKFTLTMPDGSTAGYPEGIGGAQQVVGYWAPQGGYRCFSWTPQGGAVDLGTIGHGHDCRAFGVNRNGQIVGETKVTYKGQVRAFLYENGALRNLGVLPGGDMSTAYSINDRGHVVGSSTVDVGGPNEGGHAMFWSDGKMTDIGASPDFTGTTARSVNDRDQIVGSGWSNADLANHALFFSLGAAPVALNTLVDELADWNLEYAWSINDDGVIVGFGTRSDGQNHGFMLTPIAP